MFSPFYKLASVALIVMCLEKTIGAELPAKEIGVGDQAPVFTLKDQSDREFSLPKMIRQGPVAVVFIRSIDWCTYCQLQTVQLSENLPTPKRVLHIPQV